jgi:uncharacterized protein (TIGR03086 family)
VTASTIRTADLLHTVLTDLATVLDRTKDDGAHRPTPCTEFDVTHLREHVLGWLTLFADGLADPDGRASASIDGYQAPADGGAAAREAAGRIDTALRAGAADRPLYLGDSAMPGDLALGMILWEYQVHGWDLAVATGQPWAPPTEAADESLAFAPNMLSPDYQGEGKPFGPRVAVPDAASSFDRLLGLSGRDPGWTAA